MATRTIAPDNNLKNMPFQQADNLVLSLPTWDYSTGTPWSRDNIPAITRNDWLSIGSGWLPRRGSAKFYINNYMMTYEDGSPLRAVPVFFTPTDWVRTYNGWVASFTPLSNLPTGTQNHPWPGFITQGAGLLSVSPIYNYQFDWANTGYVPIIVAPHIDTTGWGRPIPAPTQYSSPNNNYMLASATSFNSYIATWQRELMNFTTDLPFGTVVNKTVGRQSSFITIRMFECAGMTSGIGLWISAPIPINQSDVAFYGNNPYIQPYYYNGTIIIKSDQVINPTDQVFIVIRNTGYERLSFRRAANPPGLPASF
jgi:hypothetical protein